MRRRRRRRPAATCPSDPSSRSSDVLPRRGEADRVPAAQVEGRRHRLSRRLRGREAPLLAFTPARAADGTLGFNVHAGGGLSDSPRIADALDLFVRPDQVTDTVRATLQTYREFGDFDMKAVNRFRVLVHQLGPDKVTEELRARVGSETIAAGESLWTGELERPPRCAPRHKRHALRRPVHPDGTPDRRRVVRGRAPGAHARRRRGPHVAAPEPAAHRDPRRRRAARRGLRADLHARARPVRAARLSPARARRSASSRSTT